MASSPSAPDPEVAELRVEVALLRKQLEDFASELRRAQQHVDLTMRGQLRCRACGARRIAHAKTVLDRSDGDARKQMALYQRSWWSSKTVGDLEVYACTKCGSVEWWVKHPGDLVEHEDYMRILDGEVETDPGPYR